MNAQATGYIDVSKLKPPYKRTLRNDIKATLARFGRQQFFSKHVFWVLLKDDHYKICDPDSLYSSIRPEILKLVTEGLVVVVKRGRPGKPNVYRNKNHEE